MAKKKLVTVKLTKASGSVVEWRGTGCTVHNEDGKTYLNVYESTAVGTFGIEVPQGAKVEVKP